MIVQVQEAPAPASEGEPLHALLQRLDANRDAAGEKYERLRRALVKLFDWRGVTAPDICADETLDRVARKLEAGIEVGDVVAFAHGVARYVVLEQRRSPEASHVSLDEAIYLPDTSRHDALEAARLDCLERCLDELDAEQRSLILRYYRDARRQRIDTRATLARELGLSQNALRSRAQRIRNHLERRVTALTQPA